MGSPTIASLFAQRVIVGVGDMGVSNNPSITISTYALGSCVAVIAYDAVSKAGGLLHLMLPDSRISPEKAIRQPAMFADTGLPLLFRALAGLKGVSSRLGLFVAGGASVLCLNEAFKIGERNLRATADYLALSGFVVRRSAVGGTINRTVHLNINTGEIAIKSPVASESFILGA